MLVRAFLLSSLLLGSVAAAPIASDTITMGPNTRAIDVARLVTDGKSGLALRDVDYDEIIDTIGSWGRDYIATNYPADADVAVHRRDMSLMEILETMISWAKQWMSSSGMSSGGSGVTNGTTVQRRELDFDEVIDTVANWSKAYVVANYHAEADSSAGVSRRDINYISMIETIVGWMKDFLHGGDSSSQSPSQGEQQVQRRALDYDEVVDTVVGWIKAYLGPNSGGAPVTTRNNLFERNIDTLATQLKARIHGGGALFARAGSVSILGQIVDGLISLTETVFGTNDLGSITASVISFLAKLA